MPDPSASFRGTYREQAWRRCAQLSADDGLRFTPWPHADHYPNWSLPALEAAKCAALQGGAAFDRVHLRLYEALFAESRDISDAREVVKIVGEADIDRDRFIADYRRGAGRDAVIADYRAAIDAGVGAIPTVVFPATGRTFSGLVDRARYRAAFEEAAGS